MNSTEKFYHYEWKIAKKNGNVVLAKVFKNKYRDAVISRLKKPYMQYLDEIKMFPMLYLN